jgi:hypothetical protein
MIASEIIKWLERFPPDTEIGAGVLSEGMACHITVESDKPTDWGSVELYAEEIDVYPYSGAKYIAVYDEDRQDGTWLVWDGTYHHGIGLTEEKAKEKANQLNVGI